MHPETHPPTSTDLLILGAGPVGMTLARTLAGTPWRITLVDHRPLALQDADPRVLALSHGSRQLLEPLGAWPAARATPIHDIHVSQRGGFGRTLIRREDYALPALGYVLTYADLAARLRASLALGEAPRLVCHEDSRLLRLDRDAEGCVAECLGPQGTFRLRARLVVHAEGTPGDDPEVDVHDYGQTAILCSATPERPHAGRAWERFTPDGPLALLPFGDDFSVVLTVPSATAQTWLALDDAAFCAQLAARFAGTSARRFGFTGVGARAHFPLALRQRREIVRGREVWIGNAAQTLHPVSGQGFNLGLRDAWQLCECLLAGGQEDAGAAAPLAAYAAARRLDRVGGARFTDAVVRLFSNAVTPLSWARGLGLLGLDLLPPARHFVARRMIWGARAWP
jgi:2-octaprenyl-6-methoxyphenol hydroxylase